MRIESVSANPDRVGRYYVKFEDGSTLRLYRQTMEDYAIFVGREMDDNEIERLHTDAGKMSAKMRATRILASTDVSKRDLKQRLIQKGENPEHSAEAVAWLEDLNLVDDARTAEILVRRCAAKGYGLARAKQMLYEKRIPKEYWDDALADYPDQSEYIVSYLEKTDISDSKSARKAIDALIRRGHSYAQIKKAMGRIPMEEDFSED
jgi:regulatory protein